MGKNADSAVDTSILSPHRNLTDFRSRAFVATPHFLVGPEETALVDPKYGLETRFFVSHVVPATLLVQGRSLQQAESSVETDVSVNGNLLGTVTFGAELTAHEFILNPQNLRVGRNLVSYSPRKKILLAKSRVLARYAPAQGAKTKFATTMKKGKEKHELFLPYTKSLDFPHRIQPGEVRFQIEVTDEWNEPGAPNALIAPSLVVRVRSDDPPFDKSHTFHVGEPVQFPLPGTLREVSLSLTAEPNEFPLIGQNGLRLTNPEFSYSSSGGTPSESLSLPFERPTAAQQPTFDKRPNVLLYLVDTLRADHLSCYGYERQTSPNLDKFAKDSVLFEDVSAQSSWAKPSTATILTGLHPTVHGAVDFGDKVPESIESLAEILNRADYQSRAFSANVFASDHYGVTQGFQTSLTPEETSHFLGDRALEWLGSRNPDKPFFLYLHTTDPHSPYAPPKRFNNWSQRTGTTPGELVRIKSDTHENYAYRRAPRPEVVDELIDLYDGEILSNDAAFGRLVQELKSRKLYDNTLILVVSDHGEEFFEHGGLGHVSSLYQELIQVPWLVKFPNQVGAGTRVKGEWQHLDIAPTILSTLGLPIPGNLKGLAYSPESPREPTDRSIFLHVDVGVDAKNSLQGDESYRIRILGLRKQNFTLFETLAHRTNIVEPLSLFELTSDPEQARNVVERLSTRVAFLRSRLKDLSSQQPLGPIERNPDKVLEKHLKGLQYL